jgi:nucleoid-associated protein YgaU
MAFGMSGCMHGLFSSDPYSMPEVLKAEMQRAQQSATALRAEIERLQNELSVTRIGKAQLEGSLRDAERRIGESRQVIEFQREELARARNDRERVVTAGKELQAQLTSLQSQLAEQTRLQQQMVELVNRPTRTAPVARARKATSPSIVRETAPALPPHILALRPPPEPPVNGHTALKQVEVKRGDTLMSISRQYHVNLTQLKSLNNIAEPDRIQAGQVLVLPSGAQETKYANEIPSEAEVGPAP